MYDFAISYAGNDKIIAEKIINMIKSDYGEFSIFFAPNEQYQLVGRDGESFFEQLFSKSKQVIVLISESYKKKKWPRYEWDVILERNRENRFIPIRIDDAKILGLPSNIIYLKYDNNISEIAEICIKKLLDYEEQQGIVRKTEYDKIYENMLNSEGSVDKAYQLVVDNRKRTQLANINFPTGHYSPIYKIIQKKLLKKSVIKRLSIDILLPKNLTKDEVTFNIEYCIATEFNEEKPDALCIQAYCKDNNFIDFNSVPNIARADFAPYGDWGKALDGFTYNLPVDKFRTKIEYFDGYFDPSVKKRTADSLAEEIVLEMLSKRNKD